MTLTIGSLFSGIGGLELGLEMAGIGSVVWQVELDAYCRAVLAMHWPNARRYSDVTSVGARDLGAADIVCGGFPCQDISSAGKRAGIRGARSGLWFQFARIVGEIRPQWVVVENVASGARSWVDVVVQGLGEHGYACLPIPIAAADVGAPHERSTVFIVAAHADARRKLAQPIHAKVAGSPAPTNAQQLQLRHEQGRRGRSGRRNAAELAHAGWCAAQPDMVRVVHGVSRELDSATARIRALGNAVVPQCAEVIGHVLLQLGAQGLRGGGGL